MTGDNVTPDPLHPDFTHLRQIYFDVEPNYNGRFTVPTLYDKKQKTIVSNESAEIIRMFYHEFDHLLPEKYAKLELLPEDLKQSIEDTNEWTYNDINNGKSMLLLSIGMDANKVQVYTRVVSQRSLLVRNWDKPLLTSLSDLKTPMRRP